MPRPLRFQPEEWTTHFVTSRCIQSRMLLRPSRAGNRLIVGVFARALERYDVRIFGLCVLSNHYHLLIATPDASTLSSCTSTLRRRRPASTKISPPSPEAGMGHAPEGSRLEVQKNKAQRTQSVQLFYCSPTSTTGVDKDIPSLTQSGEGISVEAPGVEPGSENGPR